MASTKTRTKTIRLANETADYFERVPLNRVAECVHRLLESGVLEFDGEIKVKGSPDYPVEVMKDIDTMAGLFGVSTKDIIEGVGELMNDGSLSVENGRLVCTLPEWVIRIEDMCRDKGIPVEKVVGMVERW